MYVNITKSKISKLQRKNDYRYYQNIEDIFTTINVIHQPAQITKSDYQSYQNIEDTITTIKVLHQHAQIRVIINITKTLKT